MNMIIILLHEDGEYMKAKEVILELKNINAYYGSIHVLKDINIKVYKGEIVSLIGGNGAGKTTTLRVISALLPVRSGEIYYEGEIVNNTPSHKLAIKGMGSVPEGRKIFPKMTVKENLEMGAFKFKDRKRVNKNIEEMYIHFPILKERARQKGGTLSGGEQQMLAIARALMGEPDILLMDEPSMGLAPLMVKQIFQTISKLNEEGRTILLIEQNAQKSLQICHRGYVIQNGKIVIESTGRELLANTKIKDAYLS